MLLRDGDDTGAGENELNEVYRTRTKIHSLSEANRRSLPLTINYFLCYDVLYRNHNKSTSSKLQHMDGGNECCATG